MGIRHFSYNFRGIYSKTSVSELKSVEKSSKLGRVTSTVSREINRNGGRDRYRATEADQRAWDRARRPKQCKLAMNRPLARRVAAKLKQNWSPEQIAGWLKAEYPRDKRYHVSHETIYQSLFIQARGAIKKELTAHLGFYPVTTDG